MMAEKKEGYFKTRHTEISRSKVERLVGKKRKFLPAFHKAYKRKDVDTFVEFIRENKLEEVFMKNSYDDILAIDSKEQAEVSTFMRTAEKIGIPYLGRIYGDDLLQKLQKAYESGKINYMDIYQLAEIKQDTDLENQAQIMCKIIALAMDKSLTVGIHRTGGWENSGKIINEQGLILTGHLSSGVDSREYTDIKSKLEENVTFNFKPGLLVRQIAVGGHYKNYGLNELVDISIIAIPKDEFQKENQEIILEDGEQLILNPKFIKGYVTVDFRKLTLEQYTENPKYIERPKFQDTEKDEAEEWMEKFEGWDETSRDSKFDEIKKKILSVFDKAFHHDREER